MKQVNWLENLLHFISLIKYKRVLNHFLNTYPHALKHHQIYHNRIIIQIIYRIINIQINKKCVRFDVFIHCLFYYDYYFYHSVLYIIRTQMRRLRCFWLMLMTLLSHLILIYRVFFCFLFTATHTKRFVCGWKFIFYILCFAFLLTWNSVS